ATVPLIICLNGPATAEIPTLSLHDALPISWLPNSPGQTAGPKPPILWLLRRIGKDPEEFHRINPRNCAASAPGHPCRHCGQLSRSEEHTSELQSRFDLVCRLLLEKKNQQL